LLVRQKRSSRLSKTWREGTPRGTKTTPSIHPPFLNPFFNMTTSLIHKPLP